MDRFGRRYTIIPGLLLCASSMLFLAATAHYGTSFAWFVAAFIAIHMSVNVISGNMQTLGTDVAPPNARGMFFGASRTVAQGGSTLSPASFSILTGLLTAGAGFLFLGAAAFAGSLIVIFLVPETLRRSETTAVKSAEAPN